MHGVAHSLLQVIGTELVYEVPLTRYYVSAACNPGKGDDCKRLPVLHPHLSGNRIGTETLSQVWESSTFGPNHRVVRPRVKVVIKGRDILGYWYIISTYWGNYMTSSTPK